MKPLLLDVEFPYRAYGIPHGGRNVVSADIRGRTSVTIDVVGTEAFQPAIMRRTLEIGAVVPEHLTATWYGRNGTLWRPFCATAQAPKGVHIDSFRDACASFEARTDYFLETRDPFRLLNREILVIDRNFRRPRKFRADARLWPTEFPFRALVSSDLERRRADAQRMADSLAVVDDHIWHRCHDPVWELRTHSPVARAAIQEGWGPDGFRVDRRFHFETWVMDSIRKGQLKPGQSKLRGPLRYDDEVEILDGSFFNRNDAEHIILNVPRILDETRVVILDRSAKVIGDWVGLRDLTAKLEGEWSRFDFDRALDAMNEVRNDLVLLYSDPDFDRRKFPEVRWAVDGMGEILRRCRLVEGWISSGDGNPLSEADLDSLARLGP
jgi:hypothetical protein